jgi:HK97 family phage major capsid protein
MAEEKQFDPQEIKQAVEGVNRAFEEFKTTQNERLDEKADKGSIDVLLNEKMERVNQAIDAHQDELDAFLARQKRIERYGAPGSETAEQAEAKAAKFGAYLSKHGRNRPASFNVDDLAAYKKSYQMFLREGGLNGDALEPEDRKALSVGSDPDGGYLVHPDMSGQVVGRIFETSPMRQYASVQVISTDALEGLHDNDEATSGWVAEGGARTETDTPELDKWRIPVHEQYAAPRATQKLLDDAEINAEQWLANKVADRMARTEATAFVTGNGVGRPRGFATYGDWATAGTYEVGALEQFDTGVSGDFAAAPAGLDILVTALHALQQQYRNNATWFMNRTTLGAARLEKDSNGDFLWMPSIAAGMPSTLLGYPVANFEDMADYTTTGALAIAVGDMRAAYQIVDRAGIRILRDPYSNKPEVEFYTVKRVGGDVVNFEALKMIRFA